MTRASLLAVLLSALLAPLGASAGGIQNLAAVTALQQEEEPPPEIEAYPGEKEPDCE